MAIEAILTQYDMPALIGKSKADLLFTLSLGHREMEHQADANPRDAAYFRKEAKRYGDAYDAIKVVEE